MLTLKTARDRARQHIQTMGDGLVLQADPVTSGAYGWVFEFQSRAFMETNDIRHALVGNAPILVEKNGGRIVTLGTAYDVRTYVHMYETFGDPHAEPGPTLALQGWRTGAHKIAAIKDIQRHTQLSLKDAKGAIDACLAGKRPTLLCTDPDTAALLVRRLVDLGFNVTQLACERTQS